jgi:HK97 family phage prohead protease
MEKIYNYKTFDLGFKDIDTKQGIVTGYFASFNTVDAENDVILPGAFTKTISENFNRIKHLLDHNVQKAVGKIQTLKEDSKGLDYASKAGMHNMGRDFLKMAESGIITEHSIGFQIPKGKATVKDGIRYISEIKLYEGSSLQGWGMNENTPLTGIKSIWKDQEAIQKRLKALDTFCRNSDATDETIELLLIEVKQLTQIIINISQDELSIEFDESTTLAGVEPPMPEKQLNTGLILAYLSL